ncbi:hypothetical protein [Aporhodopirellula aestuarii]|uniref:Lipoprotein n=1 Tax=Aporhodopirellula aestuarii TaxID=2950107 RepID=A0ABT0U930_9BACT|nr:hypothetical protein [Aporhodopirellula aestuarii]MCM2373425.1 hypothetical protein [Aporhodopirellula aestuarii]
MPKPRDQTKPDRKDPEWGFQTRGPLIATVSRLATIRVLSIIILFLVAGCAVEKPTHTLTPLGATLPDEALDALRHGSEFTLYSLDPALIDPAPNSGRFHNYRVLGTTDPADPDRQSLVDALARGVAESVGAIAACFDPRHGIRVVHDQKQHDFVICFDCLQIHWYVDGDGRRSVLTSESPVAVFNAVLSRASVPLPDPP